MKSTKLILSAVILASLAACTASDGAKKQRDFCYKFDKFENICLDGDHASSDVKSQDKSTPDRSDDSPSDNNNNNNNNSGNNNNDKQNDSKKDAEKDCNCNYGGSYDQYALQYMIKPASWQAFLLLFCRFISAREWL